MAEIAQSARRRTHLNEYLAMGAMIAVGIATIVAAMSPSPAPVNVRELVGPMLAMFVLTAIVWLLMVVFRFGAVLKGAASIKYFRDYKTEPPDEWIERAARTFNNLMQVPALFYVTALLMMIIPWVDRAQINLAWIFVATRLLHTIIYIGLNSVPIRFAAWAVGCITLAVMWMRFALSV